MATIATTYAYADGSTLVPASHNNNIYSTSAGVGIMSEPNGGLSGANLGAAFLLRREHLQAGGTIAVAASMMDDVNEYVCEYMGDTTNTRFVAIGGCACRGYIPFTPSSTRFVVQSFVIPGAIATYDAGVGNVTRYATRLVVFINGTRYDHTNVPLATPSDLENATMTLSAARPLGVATSPNWVSHAITLTSGITAGFNEVSLRLYLERPATTHDVSFAMSLGSITTSATLFSRAGFGFRNAFFIAKA